MDAADAPVSGGAWSDELSDALLASGVPFTTLPRGGAGGGAEQEATSPGLLLKLYLPSASAWRLFPDATPPPQATACDSGVHSATAAAYIGVLLIDTQRLHVYYAALRFEELARRLIVTYARHAVRALEQAAHAAAAGVEGATAAGTAAPAAWRHRLLAARAARALYRLHHYPHPCSRHSSPPSSASSPPSPIRPGARPSTSTQAEAEAALQLEKGEEEEDRARLAAHARIELLRTLLGYRCSLRTGDTVEVEHQLSETDADISIGLHPAPLLTSGTTARTHTSSTADGEAEADPDARLLLAGIASVRISLSFDALLSRAHAADVLSRHLLLPLIATASALASASTSASGIRAALQGASGSSADEHQRHRHLHVQSMHDALDTTARVLCDTSASGLLLHVHLQQQRSSQAPLTVPPVSLWRAVARCSQPPAAASAGADADTNALLRAQPPSSGLVSAFEDEHEQYQQQRLAGEGENYSAPAANDAAAPTRKYLGPARLPDDKPSSGAPGAATTPAVHAETQVQRPFLSLSPPALPKQDDGSDTEDEEDDDKYKPTLSSSAHHSLASAGTPYSSQPASTSMPLPGIAAASARVTAAPASASQAPKRPLAAPGTTAAEAHKRAELDALRERARVAKRPRVAPTPGSHAGVTDRRVHSCSDDDEENGVNVEDNGGAVTAAAAHPQAGRAENRLPIPPPPPSSATPPNSSGVTPSTADSSVSSSSSTKKTLTKTSGRAARMRF